MSPSETERFAIYFAPDGETELARRGAAWLGRDAATGADVSRPAVDWIDPDEAATLTASAARYGFHATLKAPFALPPGVAPAALDAAFDAFAASQTAFSASLTVAALGPFIALQEAAPAPQIHELHRTALMSFASFRAPLTEAQKARRLAGSLTDGQAAHLDAYGYPYVLDQFRFHMTLTGPVADDARRAQLVAALSAYFAPALREPVRFDAVSLFHQTSSDEAFVEHRRAAFAAA